MDTTTAGFLGAIIGAGASLVGLLIQQHFQAKRERMEIAADLGKTEYQYDIMFAKAAGDGRIAPISAYVIYHARLLEEISKGCINAETIRALTKERDEVLAAFPNAPNKQ